MGHIRGSYMCCPAYPVTDTVLPAYSDTGYSDTLLAVTILRNDWFVTELPLLTVTCPKGVTESGEICSKAAPP